MDLGIIGPSENYQFNSTVNAFKLSQEKENKLVYIEVHRRFKISIAASYSYYITS